MKKNYLIIVFLLFSFIQLNFGPICYSQVVHTGIIWVVPNRADAFPVNGNRTGNFGLNIAFDDFYVTQYSFLDSLYMGGLLYKQPIYEIKLQSELADFEFEFINILHYCFDGFFLGIALPYYNPIPSEGPINSTDNGRIFLESDSPNFDYSLLPASNISSYNIQINNILNQYDINYYSYTPFVLNSGDTIIRFIDISCKYEDALPLYYDLLNLSYLYDNINVASFRPFSDTGFNCGSYSEISDEKEPSLTIFPNPAQDEITISGVEPESVILYDMMGKMVVSKFDPETNKIDISQLPGGFYVIKITSNDGKFYTGKIVKE